MNDIRTELNRIAEKINQAIQQDDYPERINPFFLKEAVRAYPCMGGKRLRPALLMWSCGLLGGDPEQALSAACAVEIYHNWTLVHDDIIDRDELRRGIPTTHTVLGSYAEKTYGASSDEAAKFGSDFAILAGDLQQSWAINMMLKTADHGVPAELVLYLAKKMQEDLARDLISGEALDVEFEKISPEQMTSDEVLKMISGKTGAILKFAVRCGGAIALKTPDFKAAELCKLSTYAEYLALAFQLQDDYLGVYGSEKEFGKPLCSDFQEAKPTILFLEALRRSDLTEKKELLSLTRLTEYPADVQARIRTLLDSCGAADEVRRQVKAFSVQALNSLTALPDNRYRKNLEDLVELLIDRNV